MLAFAGLLLLGGRLGDLYGRRRVVLVHGIEPSLRWKSYCTEILEIAQSLGVTTVVTLGALLADVPHTRPIPVSVTSDDPAVQHPLDV